MKHFYEIKAVSGTFLFVR